MDKVQTRNDLTAAVPKFCLSLETHRRTSEGRVRTSQEFLSHFFPHDAGSSTDRMFRYMPNDVRGPILAAWGIRGAKAAMRDDDAKVQSVVFDALVAGDIDHSAFEEGLGADTVVRWAPLAEWWTFWRGGKLTKVAIQKALSVAYELQLFDAKWFFDTLEGRGGKLRGTDVIADGLSKDDLTEWMRNVHQSGDGSPKGVLTAIGWDKIVAKTANEVLIAVIDSMVQKAGLVKGATPPEKPPEKTSDKGQEKGSDKGALAAPAAPAQTAGSTSSSGGGSASAAGGGASTGGATQAAAVSAPQAQPATGDRPTKPPQSENASDIEWPDEVGGKGVHGTTTAVPGAPATPATGASTEAETTVSQKGDILGGPDSTASDDGMIVVVDEEMELGEAATPARGENDPPTAPRLEAAPPFNPPEEPPAPPQKGGKRSERPAPAAPPVPPNRNTRVPAR